MNKLKGLFLNVKEDVCSIYESGKMCYDNLVDSKIYKLDYVELNSENCEINLNYDFYIFNYHWVKMNYLNTKLIKNLPGFKATIVLEMSQNSPFDCVSEFDFDAYFVLDPTCKHFMKNVYAFPRPLDSINESIPTYENKSVPVIGTFGLSFSDKGFDEVIKAVNEEFQKALIKINVPISENVSDKSILEFKDKIKNYKLKDEITFEITHHYFNKIDLVKWCAQNTLNVFLYNRRIGNGLAATTDQAILSGRPLAISTNPTFRHIHTYLKPYPYWSLKDSIEKSIPLIKQIQIDWCKNNFISKFENILVENNVTTNKYKENKTVNFKIYNSNYNLFNLKYFKKLLKYLLPPIFPIIINKIRYSKHIPKNSFLPLKPFTHQILQSFSQFQEDLLINSLLGDKQNGIYVDIGANDPFYNSNTQKFYSKGWTGINIEPGVEEYNKLSSMRVRDINLNMAVSCNVGKLQFFKIGNDSSLSTLDYETAVKMSKTYNKPIFTTNVEVCKLSDILEKHLIDCKIDFMTVDAEGHDLEVLKSNNWLKYRPTLVMVESNIDSYEIIKFMDENKYLYIFSNNVNAIFIDKTTKDHNIVQNIIWNTN